MLNRGKTTPSNRQPKGFALPTVLIASIAMFLVLLASVSSAVAARTALSDQFYNRIAQNAADAGLEYAKACVADAVVTGVGWNANIVLSPDKDCLGNPISSNDGYDTNFDKYRTTFSVSCADYSECSAVDDIRLLVSVGSIELLRDMGGGDFDVWRTYSANSSAQ